jgi:serine/threonine protein kinase
MPDYSRELPFGYLLNEYKVLKVLGQGSFGITYLAEDTSLKLQVAIKEYFPREFSSRDSTNTIRPNNTLEERELFQWGKRIALLKKVAY